MLIILTFSSAQERDRFEYIFHRYRRLRLHKAYEILHDYALAEDAASEGFLRIYKNLHKLGDPDSPATASFCVTVVKNVALTMRTRERPVEELDAQERADSFNLEEQVLGALTAQEVGRLLDGLGEELKSVFLLKYGHDMSHREIARTLNISENNVTVRLHRGRKKLGELLRREGIAGG